jgi:hypothetical protein
LTETYQSDSSIIGELYSPFKITYGISFRAGSALYKGGNMGDLNRQGFISRISGAKGTRPAFIAVRVFLAMSMCMWTVGPAIAVAVDDIVPPADIPIEQPSDTAPTDPVPPPAEVTVDAAPEAPGGAVEGPDAPVDSAPVATQDVPVEAEHYYLVSGQVKDQYGDIVQGATVTLSITPSRSGLPLTSTTNALGIFSFFKLNNSSIQTGDSLTIKVTGVPSGFTGPASPAQYNFTYTGSTMTKIGQDFTVAANTWTISGRSWIDLNGNDTYDSFPEEGLVGWNINVDETGWFGANYNATTGVGGVWSQVVREGTYKVSQDEDSLYECIFPASGDYSNINVNSSLTDYDFESKLRDFTIHGHVYNDTNGDGNRDSGEPGLSGYTVDLTGDSTGFQQTDGDGGYTFSVKGGGNYSVSLEQQGMAVATEPLSSTTYSHNNIVNDQCWNDFGCYEPMSISGTKYNDLNGNGVMDPGEPPLAGVTIYLDLNNNGVWDNVGDAYGGTCNEPGTVTGEDGTYTLTDVPSSGISSTGWFFDWLFNWFLNWTTYSVREVATAGWQQTQPGDTQFTSWDWDDDNSAAYRICKASGGDHTGVDFGNTYTETTTVSGTKWFDADGDGVLDVDETTGLEGWTIFIDYNDDGILDPGEPSAVTAADGTYTISAMSLPVANIEGTNFSIAEVVPEVPAGSNTYFPTNPASGAQDVLLVPGGQVTGIDFLNTQCGTISGTLWDDLNQNHILDPGEPPLVGWTVWIDPVSGGASMNSAVVSGHFMQTLTDANGFYAFICVPPGTYILGVMAPAGWESTFPPGGFQTEVTLSGGQTLNPGTSIGFGGAVTPQTTLPYTGR